MTAPDDLALRPRVARHAAGREAARSPRGGLGADLGAGVVDHFSRGWGSDAAHVHAVLLACDGERWLGQSLHALDAQTRPPQTTTTLDAASLDDSALVLREHARATGARALAVRRRTTLLDAARAACVAADAAQPLAEAAHDVRAHGRSASPTEVGTSWVWLLHDDTAPEPDALEQLLAAVEVAPSVGIAGCKVLDWDDPTLLRQAGFATSTLGRRLTGVEPGEADQGQRDHADDVLAVSSAGMLVRRDLLDALGGDPALGVLGEDLDLCRRARLAGARVVVVPSAVLRHADATREGLRSARSARSLRWSERRAAVHARLVGAPPAGLLLVVAAVLAGALARALGRVAIKQPDRAVGEVTAVLAALLRPGRVRTARRAAAVTARRPRRVLRPLYVSRRDVLRWHRDRWTRAPFADGTLTADDELLDPLGPRVPLDAEQAHGSVDVAASAPASEGSAQAHGSSTAALLAVLTLLTVAGLVAQHRLVGGGDLAGGALLPAPGWQELWRAARSTWQAAGLGAAAPADPWLTLLALLSLPVGAAPGVAVLALELLAPPLAGLTAWMAAGALTAHPGRSSRDGGNSTVRRGSVTARAAAALTWGSALPLLTAVTTGRLGAVVAHVALPLVALGLARVAGARVRRRALPAAAGAGLAAAVVVAGAPLLLPGLLVLLLVVAATARRWTSCLLWSALAPTVAVGPLLTAAFTDPGVLVLSPGESVPVAAAPGWAQLLGVPAASGQVSLAAELRGLVRAASGGSSTAAGTVALDAAALDAAALAVGALLAVLALVAVIRTTSAGHRTAGRLARTGAWTAAVGLLTATAAGVVAADGVGTAAWTGPAASLALLGLLLAALAGATVRRPHPSASLAAADPPHRRRAPRAASVALAVLSLLALVAPAAALAAWTRAGLGQPGPTAVDRRTSAQAAVAVDGAASADAVRTLTMSFAADGSVVAAVDRGPRTLADPSAVRTSAAATAARTRAAAGQGAALPVDAGSAAVLAVTAGLASGHGDAGQLADLGVGFVLVEGSRAAGGGSSSTSGPSTSALDAVPGLARAGSTAAGTLYRVVATGTGRPARVRLLDGGRPVAVLPSSGTRASGVVPAGAGQRTLVLAERADAGWHARLDGHALAPADAGWAAAFTVPASGGRVTVSRTDPTAAAWSLLQLAVLGLTVLLAVPVPHLRHRGRAR